MIMILHTILPILLAVSFPILIIISALYHSFTEEAELADEYLWKMKSCSVFDLPDNLNLESMYKSRSTQKLDVERMMGKPTQAVEIDWEIENPDEIVEFEFEQPSYIHTEGKIYQKQTVIAFEDGELIESDYHYKPIYIEHEQPSYEIPTMKLLDKYITFYSLVDQPLISEYRGNKYWLRSCNRDSYDKGWTCIGTHYIGR